MKAAFTLPILTSLTEYRPKTESGTDMTALVIAHTAQRTAALTSSSSSSSAPKYTASSTYMTITLPYPDADSNGFIDTANNVSRVADVRIYWLDEEHKLWVRIPSVTLDTTRKTVSAQTQYFGTFILFSDPNNDVSGAYAYPVPYKPSAGHKNITFTNLAQVCTIKIYTIAGELVKTIVENDGDATSVWDVTSDSGNQVFSGVYIYVIKSKTETKTGKLMIIR